jgi:pyruvate/2-oxoacid:ferredoxin oxidoreductase beta subunit
MPKDADLSILTERKGPSIVIAYSHCINTINSERL